MSRTSRWVLTGAVLLAMGWMVFNSMARVKHECEVCVVFNGVRRCTKGAGATEEEARQGAQTAACGVLAAGMNETIRCQNTPPATATCTN